MDQIIQKPLAGRRFALMGFETPEADSIIAALETVRGFGHVVGAASNIPGLNSFSPFDACFINASAIGTGEQPSPIEMIARGRKPAVIIGTPEELVTRFAAVADLNRDFMIRPWQPEELLLRAYRILRFVESATNTTGSPGRNSSPRAVLADDDAMTIAMISTILRHHNFECDIAHDGTQACEIARMKKSDLALLAVSMPNGFEALAALRADPATKNMRLIMVSAHREEAAVVKSFSLGADDYISKPFSPGELMARIGRVLRESGERREMTGTV